MAIREDLLAIEEKFWTGDAEYYRQNLDDSCLMAFTEMTGVFGKEDVAGMIKDGNRWRDLNIELKGILGPSPGMAIISYRARATRATGEPYAALVTSGYVKRSGAWKMAFHQQTPLDQTATS